MLDKLSSLDRALAWSRLVKAIAQLDPLPRLVLRWQLGVGGQVADATTIGCRLALPVAQVDRLVEQALEELAWALLSLDVSEVRTGEAA